MNKQVITAIAFLAGAAAGAIVTSFNLKKKYEAQLAEELAAAKEFYETQVAESTEKSYELYEKAAQAIQKFTDSAKEAAEEDESEEEEEEEIDLEDPDVAPSDDYYQAIIAHYRGTDQCQTYLKPVKREKPFVIDHDDFNTMGYGTYEMDLYSDGVLADECGAVIDDKTIDTYIGIKNLKRFIDDDENDQLFIRNDKLQLDIEICKWCEAYKDDHDEPYEESRLYML